MNLRSSSWLVTIPYREPLFTQRTPGAPSEYVMTYKVEADTSEDAKDLALILFRASARDSSVRWARDPIHERIIVLPVCGLTGG